MSFPPFFLKTLLLASAVAGFAFVGCGEESDTSDTSDETSEATAKDEEDAGRDDKDARADDAENEDEEDEGAEDECEEDEIEACDECDNAPCEQRCEDGEWSECTSIPDTIGDLADAGLVPSLPDGSVTVDDGGVTVTLGDASIRAPTMECPDSLQCASEGMGIAGMAIGTALGGASFCADPADPAGLPPTCSTAEDCQELGLTTSTCMELPFVGSLCIQLCQ